MISVILLVLFIPVCLFLILVVLLQAGKGGGLSGAFGGAGAQTFLGARGTSDFLTKITTYFIIAFMVLAFLLSFTYGRQKTISIEEKPAATETSTTAPAGETSQPQAPSSDQGSTVPPTPSGGQK